MARHPHKVERARIGFGFILFLLIIVATIVWTNGARTPNLPKPPLKDLASNHDLSLGNLASPSLLSSKPYSNILSSQYNFVTTTGQMGWASIQPSAGTYNFKSLDKVFNYAGAHAMGVQGQSLVSADAASQPAWLISGHYNKTQLLNILHKHIQTTASHYKGKVSSWLVVSSAFSQPDWWASHAGGQSYIDQAFIWAHLSDPSAKLILNGSGNATENSASNAMYAYVKAALGRHVPINGIGLSLNINGANPPAGSEVIKNMQRFGALGLNVYVTDFSVDMSGVAGTQAQRDQIEAGIYKSMIQACIESEVCHSFAEAGITDRNFPANAEPMPFDSKYRPKPAYYSLREALE